MTKTFKIGEEAIGGIIKIIIDPELIYIMALDYKTKKVLTNNGFYLDDPFIQTEITDLLESLTTCYHADRIKKWIENINPSKI